MLKRNRAKIFCPDQNWPNFGGFGGLRSGGPKSVTSLPESPSFKPFCVSIGCGACPGVFLKKHSHRTSHRNDMSPLTQGLHSRAACDIEIHCTLSTHSLLPPKKEVMFLVRSVCLFVCLSVRLSVCLSVGLLANL